MRFHPTLLPLSFDSRDEAPGKNLIGPLQYRLSDIEENHQSIVHLNMMGNDNRRCCALKLYVKLFLFKILLSLSVLVQFNKCCIAFKLGKWFYLDAQSEKTCGILPTRIELQSPATEALKLIERSSISIFCDALSTY